MFLYKATFYSATTYLVRWQALQKGVPRFAPARLALPETRSAAFLRNKPDC